MTKMGPRDRASDHREVETRLRELEFLNKLATVLSNELSCIHTRISMTSRMIQAIQDKYKETTCD